MIDLDLESIYCLFSCFQLLQVFHSIYNSPLSDLWAGNPTFSGARSGEHRSGAFFDDREITPHLRADLQLF